MDDLLQYGKSAFDPELSKESRASNRPKFVELIERYSQSSYSKTGGANTNVIAPEQWLSCLH